MHKLQNTVQEEKGERRIHSGVMCVLKKKKKEPKYTVESFVQWHLTRVPILRISLSKLSLDMMEQYSATLKPSYTYK
jgi:hypothetical protein